MHRSPSLTQDESRDQSGRNLGPSVWFVRRAPGPTRDRGLIDAGGRVFPCVLGATGITVLKREGDRATPAGTHRVIGGWVRRDRVRPDRTCCDLDAIGPADGWCDDPGHPAYNHPVRLPFAASHERMMRSDRLYNICFVLDWNIHPRRRGRGSAIFFHLAPENGGPTLGCVAVEPTVMRQLLARMRPGQILKILP